MRYSKEHKSETRARIVATAAPLFRKFGFSAVSVDKLMNAANLTRGGFYAHFESKEALIEELLSRDAGLVRMLGEREGKTRQSLNADALRILSDYLDAENLEEIVKGCPLATMPVDASRSSHRLRSAYGNRFHMLIEQLRRGLGKSKKDEEKAIAVAVLAVGGVLFARASASNKEAVSIEKACYKQISRLLDDT